MKSSAPGVDDSGLSIAELASQKAQLWPHRVAFHFDDGQWVTYRDIYAEALEVASGLRQLGLSQGDVVSFQLPNWREAAAINLAACLLGLVINPITPISRASELRWILADSGSKVVFIPTVYRAFDYERMLASVVAEASSPVVIVIVRGEASGQLSYGELRTRAKRAAPPPRVVDPDAIKLLMYTSGTTGRAKGVLHTHRTIASIVQIASGIMHDSAPNVMLMPSPVTHITGYYAGLELPFRQDFCVVLMDLWRPEVALRLIGEHQVSHAGGATVFLKELLDEAERRQDRMPSLRVFGCGGASVPPELIARADRATDGCVAYRAYGSTEAPIVSGIAADVDHDVAADDLRARSETDGRINNYDVRIAGLAGETLVDEREGEILVRGPALFVGYTDEAETNAAFADAGFFRTGDIGLVTPNDEIIITGRKKDLIVRGGENLSPVEIEDAIAKHPAVLEPVVVAMPHPRLGEAVCAFLIIKDEAQPLTLIELIEFLDEVGLARQKFPERLEIVATFPRTPSGKVRKDVLRKALQEKLRISYA